MTPSTDPAILQELRALIGRTLADRYQLVRLVGVGGMAGVFEGQRLADGGRVAVKVLHGAEHAHQPSRARRFAREAEVIAALDHPNALPLFDYGLIAGETPYLVTEFVDGETLGGLLRQGTLAPLTVVRIMQQICDVLAAAHGKGIIHRDLKPENLVVESIDGGRGDWVMVRVLDFGLASWRNRGRLTMRGTVMGSPRYMAPEQALDRPLDGRTDLYALGVIAYECLTGQPPFLAGNAMAEMVMHVSEKPVPVDRRSVMPLDPALAELVMGLLAKRPGDRPQSAEEVRATLEQIEARLDPEADDERDTAAMAPISAMRAIKPRS